MIETTIVISYDSGDQQDVCNKHEKDLEDKEGHKHLRAVIAAAIVKTKTIRKRIAESAPAGGKPELNAAALKHVDFRARCADPIIVGALYARLRCQVVVTGIGERVHQNRSTIELAICRSICRAVISRIGYGRYGLRASRWTWLLACTAPTCMPQA